MEAAATPIFTSISLVAAFVAGMVALFAPCCLSYLLPTYLGNIFKERKQVMLMTVVYSLGIFTVMLPIVLGAKLLADWFFTIHDQTFFLGGVFLIAVAAFSFLGIKLPMPHFAGPQLRGGIWSTYLLGLISGVTSACCAPVLIGVMTLSSLSPSLLQALGVGVMYVAGMVAPLYFASAFIHKRNLLERPILRRRLFTLSLLGSTFPILVSNLVAGAVFLATGIFIIILTLSGQLSMGDQSQVTQAIQLTATNISQITNKIPGIDLIFLLTLAFIGIRLFSRKKEGKSADGSSCCIEKKL